jgi:DNA-binding NtrC family response regulator
MLQVLLVEDDIDQVMFMRTLLESPPGKFTVTPVGTLKKARAILKAGSRFDVMLLDLCLPDGDGRELLLEAQVLVPRLPVIITSATDDTDTVKACYRDGADGFIGKGTINTPAGMQFHIAGIINQREALRALYEAATGGSDGVR